MLLNASRYYLDRDPQYFTYVLEYLRSGACRSTLALPDNKDHREKVLAEFGCMWHLVVWSWERALLWALSVLVNPR